jgi:hypothetical protein
MDHIPFCFLLQIIKSISVPMKNRLSFIKEDLPPYVGAGRKRVVW